MTLLALLACIFSTSRMTHTQRFSLLEGSDALMKITTIKETRSGSPVHLERNSKPNSCKIKQNQMHAYSKRVIRPVFKLCMPICNTGNSLKDGHGRERLQLSVSESCPSYRKFNYSNMTEKQQEPTLVRCPSRELTVNIRCKTSLLLQCLSVLQKYV